MITEEEIYVTGFNLTVLATLHLSYKILISVLCQNSYILCEKASLSFPIAFFSYTPSFSFLLSSTAIFLYGHPLYIAISSSNTFKEMPPWNSATVNFESYYEIYWVIYY